MSYKFSRTDDNHSKIVKQLRQAGASVRSVATIKGFCDIIVGFRGKNFLFEIKDGSKVKSKQQLTDAEEKFQRNWVGQIKTITTFEEAYEEMTKKRI